MTKAIKTGNLDNILDTAVFLDMPEVLKACRRIKFKRISSANLGQLKAVTLK